MKTMVLVFTLLALLQTPAVSQDDGYGPMGMDGGRHMMPYGYGGLVMWILLIVAIILLVYLVTQFSKRSGDSHESRETALDILKKRYAKGEISQEEFERMKQHLHE